MAGKAGPYINNDRLVFHYDTGNTVRSFKGEPTTNLLGTTGDMAPPDPTAPFDLTTASSTSDVNGTTWDLSLYPATNLAANNGVTWDPYIKGPGFTGAWMLKKRPGGNSETQFANGYGSVSNTTDITISVWCKCEVAGVARINTNTTQNGASYWGYSSPYHTGDGTWQKLSLRIPANSGVTSVNVIRCQVLGTTLTTDTYWRHYQIEYKTNPTQFIAGTRSATQGLLDLTGKSTIDLTNVSFDSNAQIAFDGTNDQFTISDPNVGTTFSIELIIKVNDYSNSPIFISPNSVGIDHFFRIGSNGRITAQFVEIADSSTDGYSSTTVLSTTNYYHVVISKSPSNGTIYVNGVAEDSHTPTLPAAAWSGTWKIGARQNNTFWFNGELPVMKVYNRALTASEVERNFNAVRTRFGI